MAKNIQIIIANRLSFLSAIILFFLLLSSTPLPWNEPIKNVFIDLQFNIRGSRPLSDDIVMVFIGAEDVKALGGLPITRDYYWYATFLLNSLGAKVIGIDVLFDRADRNYPEYDKNLSDIFSATGKVCLPVVFSELTAKQKEREKIPTLLVGENPLYPLKTFSDHAAGLGFSNLGKIAAARKVPLIVAYQDSFMLSFGCELARLYLGGSQSVEVHPDKISFVDSLQHSFSFPIDRNGYVRLNHFGDIKNVNAISFVDLLQTFDPTQEWLNFKDKLVIIALTAPAIADIKTTPLSNALPGSFIHATVAENLIHQNYLREVPMYVGWILIILLALAAVMLWRLKNVVTIAVTQVILIGGYWLISMALFGLQNLILPLFYPTLSFLAVVSYLAMRRHWEPRQKEDSLKIC